MNRRHYIFSLLALSLVVVPCQSVRYAIGQPPAENPFELGAEDPFAGVPAHPPARDERYLQMRLEQVNNSMEVVQLKARQLAKLLRNRNENRRKNDKQLLASQLKTLVAKNWYYELELQQLKVESLNLQLKRTEKELQMMETSKNATIAERYNVILETAKLEAPRGKTDGGKSVNRSTQGSRNL